MMNIQERQKRQNFQEFILQDMAHDRHKIEEWIRSMDPHTDRQNQSHRLKLKPIHHSTLDPPSTYTKTSPSKNILPPVNEPESFDFQGTFSPQPRPPKFYRPRDMTPEPPRKSNNTFDEIRKYRTLIKQLNEELSDTRKEMEMLKEENKSLGQENEGLKQMVKRYVKDVNIMQGELAQLRKEKIKIEGDLLFARGELSELGMKNMSPKSNVRYESNLLKNEMTDSIVKPTDESFLSNNVNKILDTMEGQSQAGHSPNKINSNLEEYFIKEVEFWKKKANEYETNSIKYLQSEGMMKLLVDDNSRLNEALLKSFETINNLKTELLELTPQKDQVQFTSSDFVQSPKYSRLQKKEFPNGKDISEEMDAMINYQSSYRPLEKVQTNNTNTDDIVRMESRVSYLI